MNRRQLYTLFVCVCCAATGWAASDFAPSVPDLSLPEEAPAAASAAPAEAPAPAPVPAAPAKKAGAKKTRAARAAQSDTISITNKDFHPQDEVQKMNPVLPPIPTAPVKTAAAEKTEAKAADKAAAPADTEEVKTEEGVVPAREQQTAVNKPAPKVNVKVTYAPATDKDPMLSPMDLQLIKRREAERLRAIEAEKQRKLEAERQRLAELERQRQLELERLRDPSKEIRGKIRINGIIGEEVLIGNKVYSVGGTVLGARIVSVQPDAVVFMYKGQKFTKKVQLK